MSYGLKYCQVPISRALCYAMEPGFYPVNWELPDCVLWNGKGLGDAKFSCKKKKSMLRKFEIYCIYIPTLKNHKRTLTEMSSGCYGVNCGLPYSYVEAPIPRTSECNCI